MNVRLFANVKFLGDFREVNFFSGKLGDCRSAETKNETLQRNKSENAISLVLYL